MAINGNVAIPRVIVVVLNCSNMRSPMSRRANKNIKPCFGVMAPLASGLFLVRSTCLSKSRSHKSLMTQPAPRMMTAPMIKKVIVIMLCEERFCIPPDARVMLQRQGKSKSHMPTGRSKRKR